MAGVVAALGLLGYAFHLAEGDSPSVIPGALSTCPAPDCATCLHEVCLIGLITTSQAALFPYHNIIWILTTCPALYSLPCSW